MAEACALASSGGDAERLGAIVRRAPLLMEALRAARDVDAPDWLVSAGAIRDVVWDDMHRRPLSTPPRDVDLAFLDPADLSSEREHAVERALHAHAAGLPWQASNQAAVHLWYPQRFGRKVAPFTSSADAVATFPEIATCVGVRLMADDDMLVVAPHGLDDLLGCVCRQNPTRVPASFYQQRVADKGWITRWPHLRYVATAAAPAATSNEAGLRRTLAAPPHEHSATLHDRSPPLSSRGLGRRPLTAVTRVRIPVAVLRKRPTRRAFCRFRGA